MPTHKPPPATPTAPIHLGATPFGLLLTPAESLLVLDHLALNPREKPLKTATDLQMGINTFYRAVERLEELGLIAVERAPGGKRTRATLVTVHGREVLAALGRVPGAIADSKAGLEWELEHKPPAKGSARAGEVLCGALGRARR